MTLLSNHPTIVGLLVCWLVGWIWYRHVPPISILARHRKRMWRWRRMPRNSSRRSGWRAPCGTLLRRRWNHGGETMGKVMGNHGKSWEVMGRHGVWGEVDEFNLYFFNIIFRFRWIGWLHQATMTVFVVQHIYSVQGDSRVKPGWKWWKDVKGINWLTNGKPIFLSSWGPW